MKLLSNVNSRRCTMASNLPQFTVRVNPDLLKKFRLVADYNGRSANREIEILMRNHVTEFEKIHGKIEID